jgi:gas vesicle protein
MTRRSSMRRDDEYVVDQPYVVIEKRGAGLGTFVLGLAIGAGLALLYAPHTGEETRHELRRSVRRVRSAARDAAGDLSDSVTDHYEQAKRSVEDRLDNARRTLEIRKRQAAEAIRAGRVAAQQARDDLEARIAETKAAYNAGADVVRSGRKTAAAGPDAEDVADSESE